MSNNFIVANIVGADLAIVFQGTEGQCKGYIKREGDAGRPTHTLRISRNTERSKNMLIRSIKKLPKIT